MSNPLQVNGSMPRKRVRYAPINVNRIFTGLWTQRSPLREAATPYLYEKFYGGARYDSLWDGSNVEISNKLTLVRRPGFSTYNSSTIPSANSYYSFRYTSNNAENIFVMTDTVSDVREVTGNNNNIVYSKTLPMASNTYFQSVGNTLYMADSFANNKYLKVNGSWTTQGWGISNGNANSIGTFDTVNVTGSGVAWTNPSNAVSAINYASVTLGPSDTTSQILDVTRTGSLGISTNFFVTGIKISVTAFGSGNPTVSAFLLKGGSIVGSVRTSTVPGVSGTVNLGGSSDLWGTTWSPSDVSLAGANGFGVALFVQGNGISQSVSLRNAAVTIYYSQAPGFSTNGAGTFSATQGYKYVYCYGNSVTGHCSSATPAVGTGVFTNISYIQIAVTASLDPQVNQIRLFRTTDGGSTYFELPNSPYANSTTGIQDSSADAALNEFIQAPINSNNNPPPSGFGVLTYHSNRVWGAVGNIVYYSRTSDATPGVTTESFPPANYFIFPSQITRLWPSALGLLVFTVSDVYLISGSGTNSSPFIATPFIQGIGLRSYNAFDVNGSVVYMFTSDNQMISIDPSSGVSEIGFPIGDLLSNTATWNPANVYVTWHVSGSKDKAMYLSNGAGIYYRLSPTSAPESGLIWSPLGTISGLTVSGALQSVETSPGVHQLLLSSTNGPIYKRDLTVFSDGGNTYTAYATVGSIVLAQAGQVAEVAFVTTDSMAIGSHPTIGVLIDEISGSFESLTNRVNDPPKLAASSTVYGDRFYLNQTQLPAICRHIMVKISWPSEAAQNELLGYCFFGAYHQEK